MKSLSSVVKVANVINMWYGQLNEPLLNGGEATLLTGGGFGWIWSGWSCRFFFIWGLFWETELLILRSRSFSGLESKFK